MSKPFDPTLKTLVEVSPPAWLDLIGLPRAPTRVIDADIATIAGAVDKVIHVADEPPYLLHLDFHSGHDGPAVPRRVRLYNACLDYRHDLLVRSVVVVLRPGADSPQLSGLLERQFPGEPAHVVQRYQVLRVWQAPPDQLLEGELGTLPLAPISAVTEADLPGVIARMKRRLDRQRSKALVQDLWTATNLLMGLRYPGELIEVVLRGVIMLEESTTYQAILRKGMTEGALTEARELLLLAGRRHFGNPGAKITAALHAIQDLTRLHELHERLDAVDSWHELLGESAPPQKKRRRS